MWNWTTKQHCTDQTNGKLKLVHWRRCCLVCCILVIYVCWRIGFCRRDFLCHGFTIFSDSVFFCGICQFRQRELDNLPKRRHWHRFILSNDLNCGRQSVGLSKHGFIFLRFFHVRIICVYERLKFRNE
jgi:hypothetical protein